MLSGLARLARLLLLLLLLPRCRCIRGAALLAGRPLGWGHHRHQLLN